MDPKKAAIYREIQHMVDISQGKKVSRIGNEQIKVAQVLRNDKSPEFGFNAAKPHNVNFKGPKPESALINKEMKPYSSNKLNHIRKKMDTTLNTLTSSTESTIKSF